MSSVVERLIGLPVFAADAGESGAGGLVLLVDVERLGVGAGSLLLVAEALIGEAAAHPGLQVLRLELDRLVEIARRRLEVADRDVAQAARDDRLGRLMGEADRRREVVD